MRLSDFDFTLPADLIAQYPRSRGHSRLLCATDGLEDAYIGDIIKYAAIGDVLVLNNTRVMPSLLKAFKDNNNVGVSFNLQKLVQNDVWLAFAKPSKRVKVGDVFTIGEGFAFTVLDKALEHNEIYIKFNCQGQDFSSRLHLYGSMPLPPYIKRNEALSSDKYDYQTIFAEVEGAVAAPTAGLHFTKEVLNAIEKKGVKIVYVTLHVGPGTFLPIRHEDIRLHKMHTESFAIEKNAAEIINNAKLMGNKIIAVGTTALRALESAADDTGLLKPCTDETSIFIVPGYRVKVVDMLLTNFHMPKSTLLLLVSAFAGINEIRAIYSHAILHGYRFFSYGDACLLCREGVSC